LLMVQAALLQQLYCATSGHHVEPTLCVIGGHHLGILFCDRLPPRRTHGYVLQVATT
jgi:hypothetical protein